MIKGFLLAFNVILFALFLIGMIFGLKTKETGMGLLSGSVALIIALNSLFILNSQNCVRWRNRQTLRRKNESDSVPRAWSNGRVLSNKIWTGMQYDRIPGDNFIHVWCKSTPSQSPQFFFLLFHPFSPQRNAVKSCQRLVGISQGKDMKPACQSVQVAVQKSDYCLRTIKKEQRQGCE